MAKIKLIVSAICFLTLLLTIDSYAGSTGRSLRIISLAPATTEILFAICLDKEIVGVSTFCNYPAAANNKEKIGSFSDPNSERIMALKPDIIFSTGLEQATIVTKLRQLNLSVFVSDPKSISELFQSISSIGKITAKEKEADALIIKMKQDILAVHEKIRLNSCLVKPKVFVEIWNEPLMTAGKGSFINELIGLAGGINIAADTNKPYANFSAEQVILRNPDCIILTYMNQSRPDKILAKRLGWANIAAVKNNRVYNDIEPDLLLRPGPRVIDGIKELYRKFYQNEQAS